MSRLWSYTGSENSIGFAAGALAGQARPLSTAWLLRPTTGSGNGEFGGIFNVRTSADADIWTLITDNAYFSLPNGTGQSQYAQTWTYVGLDIPSASGGQIRWHFWREDTGTWTHVDGGTIALSGTIDNVLLGFWNGAHFAGHIAAGGFWLSALGDAGHQANGVAALQDWFDNGPAVLWSFESAGTIEDLTGGGADQTASVGSTSESTTELPGWSYAISAGGATVTGVAVVDLGALSASVSGARTVRGTAAAGLAELDSNVAGSRVVPGAAAGQMAGLNAAVAGTRTVHGSAAGDLGQLAATAAGLRTVAGAAAVDLAGLAAEASGQRTIHGAASVELGALDGSAAAAGIVAGAANVDLGSLAASAAGRRRVHGVAAVDLGGLATAAQGSVSGAVAGAAQATFGPLAAVGVSHRTVSGTAASSLAALVATGLSAAAGGTVIPRPNAGLVLRPDEGTITQSAVGVIERPTRVWP